jgi:ABC-type transporter Mla subunit MlaD
MEQKSNFRLGLFILAAILLGAVLMIGLGSGKWFNKTFLLETYFDESVQGLDIGSKVRYRGVVVGEVSAITFTYARYEQGLPRAQRLQYVLVETRLSSDMFVNKGLANPSQESLDVEVAKGLRVKIAPQGLTGTSYLEIDYLTPQSRQLPFSWTPDNLYIPSAPSTVGQFVNGAQDLMEKLKKLDLERTLTRLDLLLTTAEQKIAPLPLLSITQKMDTVLGNMTQVPVKQMAEEATNLLIEARQTNQALQTVITQPGWSSAPADFAQAAQDARKIMGDPAIASAVQRIDRVTQRLDRLTASQESEVGQLIENLNSSSASLKSILEQVEQQPSRLFFSQPVPAYIPPKP